MAELVNEFNSYRERMNKRLMKEENKVMKRILNLDTNAFMEGALPVKTKELMGLVSSMVLRCDDCVKYHLSQCYKVGVNSKELMETLSIANLIGGTIVIPHLRRAVEFWDELQAEEN